MERMSVNAIRWHAKNNPYKYRMDEAHGAVVLYEGFSGITGYAITDKEAFCDFLSRLNKDVVARCIYFSLFEIAKRENIEF